MSSAAENIQESLEEHGLESWGFVIYRCTYASEERWERFMAAVRGSAQEGVVADAEVAEALTWTVEEDAETLDGASVLDVSRRFAEWVAVEGVQELAEEEREEREEGDDPPPYPRYNFFVYVDEAMLESVVVDEAGAVGAAEGEEEGGAKNYLTLVNAAIAEELEGSRDEYVQSLRDEGFCDDIIERDRVERAERFRKRVKIEEFVGVYAYLLDIDDWEHFLPLPSGLSEF